MTTSKHSLDGREKDTVSNGKVAWDPASYFASEETHLTGKRTTETQSRRQLDSSEEKSLHGHSNRDTSASIPRHREILVLTFPSSRSGIQYQPLLMFARQ